MSADKSGVVVNSRPEPKYRADCTGWFHDTDQTARIIFDAPPDVFDVLEQAAKRAGRTFNDQLWYLIDACRGARMLDLADERSLTEWRDLIGQMKMQFNPGEKWRPCSVLFPKARS